MTNPSQERIDRIFIGAKAPLGYRDSSPVMWREIIESILTADDSHLAAEVERLQGEIRRLKRKQERMCQRKKGHPTKKAADNHILEIHLGEAENMHSYECPYCYMWHVGHKSTSYNGNPSVAVLEENKRLRKLLGEAEELLPFIAESKLDGAITLLTKIRAELSGENRGGE